VNSDVFLQPVVQYGFLGFSVVLLGVIVWLITRLLDVLGETNKVIEADTLATQNMTVAVAELMSISRSLHDKMISRPCIAKDEWNDSRR